MDDQDILERANSGMKEWLDRAQMYMDADKPADAKKMVSNAQKEVRALKAEVVAEEKEVRAQFTEARMKAGQSGQTMAMFLNSKNRSRVSRVRAASKRSIAQQREDALADYRATKAALDKAILDLDRVKLDIDLGKSNAAPSAIADAPPPPPAAPALAPPAVPPAWAADPHGRHHYRYWDGTRWTEHVSTDGVQSVDHVS